MIFIISTSVLLQLECRNTGSSGSNPKNHGRTETVCLQNFSYWSSREVSQRWCSWEVNSWGCKIYPRELPHISEETMWIPQELGLQSLIMGQHDGAVTPALGEIIYGSETPTSLEICESFLHGFRQLICLFLHGAVQWGYLWKVGHIKC